MNYAYLNLFPQQDNSIVRNAKMREQLVNFCFKIAEVMQVVLNAFYIKKTHELFDPHVGDTACQIRACRIALLAKQTQPIHFTKMRLRAIEKFRQKIISELIPNKSTVMNRHLTIKDLFIELQLDFDFSPTELFLFQCYFLTKNKINQGNNTTFINHDAIVAEWDVSKKLAKKLVRHYQLMIAADSCEQVLLWAKLSGLTSIQIKSLDNLRRQDDDNRPVLPCYFSMKVILDILLMNNINLLIIVSSDASFGSKKIYLLYKPALFNNKYILSPIDKYSIDEPCILITARSSLLNTTNEIEQIKLQFEKKDILEILLTNMAVHPQYSGDKLNEYAANPFELGDSAELAATMLTELRYMQRLTENLALLKIDHIYCTQPRFALPVLAYEFRRKQEQEESHTSLTRTTNSYSAVEVF